MLGRAFGGGLLCHRYAATNFCRVSGLSHFAKDLGHFLLSCGILKWHLLQLAREMWPDLDARWAFARNAEALVGADGDLTDDVLALLQRINAQVRACSPLPSFLQGFEEPLPNGPAVFGLFAVV